MLEGEALRNALRNNETDQFSHESESEEIEVCFLCENPLIGNHSHALILTPTGKDVMICVHSACAMMAAVGIIDPAPKIAALVNQITE